ncbi:unnamed protein product [Blepharisma stoltei]|uniref:Thioredoxin domain-containing protein n=1 Tax=Blepharisma stoltei TaxID=1481888 RepID=A0AAU9J4H4_9CILI|nr:unnamed protein product [Blepharisma stoltei]
MALKFLILIIYPLFIFALEDNPTITLTDKNFKDIVKIHQKMLVEFYIEEDIQCQNFHPEFIKAAKKLLHLSPSFKLGVFNANNSDIAVDYGITSFPKLVYFIGRIPIEYSGQMSSDSIILWTKRQLGISILYINETEDLLNKIELEKTAIVLFSKPDIPIIKSFEYIAQKIEEPAFYVSINSDTWDCFNVIQSQVIIFKDFGQEKVKLDIEETDILKFIRLIELHKKPSLIPLDSYSIDFILQNKNQAALFLRAKSEAELYKSEIEELANEYRDFITFIYGDISDYPIFSEMVGISEKNQPTFMIIDPMLSTSKYKIKNKFTISSARLLIEEFKNNSAVPYLKSQEIPENPFENSLRVLVGKNFEEIVYDKNINVIVEFMAEGCSECKDVEKEFQKLAEMLVENDNIIVSKIDMNKNDIKGIIITEFPTIKFYPANDKTGIDFKEEKSFENLLTFIQLNSDLTIKPHTPDL